MAEEKIAAGYQLMATGEMGIGNTTTSSAMAAVFLNQPVPELTGRGAGLSSEGLARKIAAIEKAIAINQPDPSDPIDVLAKVGGFDIAGMAGVFLAGAAHGVPVVMDGFISCVAALLAARIAPFAKDYMIASHVSKEPAAHLLLAELGKEAFCTAICVWARERAPSCFSRFWIRQMPYTAAWRHLTRHRSKRMCR